MMARMTSALADKILSEVAESGEFYKTACARNDVSKEAFFMWLLRSGSPEQKAFHALINEGKALIAESNLAEAISEESDEDFFELKRLTRVRGIALGLDRLRPNAKKTEISGPDGAPIQTQALNLGKFNDKELAVLQKAAEIQHGAKPSPS